MMNATDRLAHMANQIARNFAVRGDAVAAEATADHIVTFWSAEMRAALADAADGLGPIALHALAILRAGVTPAHQTLATAGQGGSDAG